MKLQTCALDTCLCTEDINKAFVNCLNCLDTDNGADPPPDAATADDVQATLAGMYTHTRYYHRRLESVRNINYPLLPII